MTDQSTRMNDKAAGSEKAGAAEREAPQNLIEEFSKAFGRGLAHAMTLAWGKVPQVTCRGMEQLPVAHLIEGFSDRHIVFETCLVGVKEGKLVAIIPAAQTQLLPSLGAGREAEEAAGPPSELAEVMNRAFAEACRSLSATLSRSIKCGLVKDGERNLDHGWFSRVFPGRSNGVRVDYEVSASEGSPVNLYLLLPETLPETLEEETDTPDSGDDSEVRPALFEELSPSLSKGETGNLDLLLDVELCVRVELGRTSLRVQEVLELGPGSVVELDKLAGEPVDLLVNEQLFARGEVVVIDENFGVRVTDIVSPMERVQAMRQAKT